MTDGERTVWAAVYATSWHQSMGGVPGVVNDRERSRWACRQAERALDALRDVGESSGPCGSQTVLEVLR